MKYGQALPQRSVPEWAPYNIDYNELKHLIKANTSRDQGQAMTIPGHGDFALQKFENIFFAELWNQHDRVDLFVKSKADEYSRRLRDYQKKTIDLVARSNLDGQRVISAKRRLRFARLESKILNCGDDIKNLERFVTAQRIGFEKILKKYRKWTGSTSLGVRFTDKVLSGPKSFTRRDFNPLYHQYEMILTLLRGSSPLQSELTTPVIPPQQSFPSPAPQDERPPTGQQHYWNEYDNGSEVGDTNEPYTIYIDPENDVSFPGAQKVVQIFTRIASGAKRPIAKVKTWFIPPSINDEQRPLLPEGWRVRPRKASTSFSTTTDMDDDGSLSDFPTGYEAHYATFPSVIDQRLSHNRQQLLFYGTLTCFAASVLLLFIAAMLITTGRHRLRAEVDAGAIVGIVASLLFSTLGFTTMIYRWAHVGPLHIFCATASFFAISALSGVFLVLVMHNIKS